MSEAIDSPFVSCERIPHDRLIAPAARALILHAQLQTNAVNSRPGNSPSMVPAIESRLVSWVENDSSMIGYGLAISGPEPSPNELIKSYFYTVNRELNNLVEQPKVFSIPKGMSIDSDDFNQFKSEVMFEFDHSDTVFMVNMLHKTVIAYDIYLQTARPPVGKRWLLDQHVKLAICEANLDELAAMSLSPCAQMAGGDPLHKPPDSEISIEQVPVAVNLYGESHAVRPKPRLLEPQL